MKQNGPRLVILFVAKLSSAYKAMHLGILAVNAQGETAYSSSKMREQLIASQGLAIGTRSSGGLGGVMQIPCVQEGFRARRALKCWRSETFLSEKHIEIECDSTG